MVAPVIINFVLSHCAGGDPVLNLTGKVLAKGDLRLPLNSSLVDNDTAKKMVTNDTAKKLCPVNARFVL